MLGRAGGARQPTRVHHSSFSQNPAPGSTLGAEEAGLGEPSSPGEAACGKTRPCVYMGHGAIFAATVALYLARCQDPPKSRQGVCSAGTFRLLLWVWGHMEPCTYDIIDFPMCVVEMLLKLFKKSIVFNLPVCLLFLLLKQKNITGVLRCTILPTPR